MCAEIECLRLKKDVRARRSSERIMTTERIMERRTYLQKSPYGISARCTNFDNKVIKGGVLVVILCGVPNVTIISQ